MNDSDAVGPYGRAWLETDAARRDELLEKAWAADAVYCDPLALLHGRQALSDHIAATQASLAGGRIAVTAEAVRHHDSVFFPWAMLDADGTQVVSGFDVAQLDDDGRITRLTGFFDPQVIGEHAAGTPGTVAGP